MKLENVWIIFRKEFLDILRDRRTLMSMILLPMLVVPLLMIGIGGMVSSQMNKMKEKRSPVALLGSRWAPVLLDSLKQAKGLQIIPDVKDTSTAVSLLQDKSIQAAVVVPENFEAVLQSPNQADDSLQIRIIFDQSNLESEMVKGKVKDALENYRQGMIQAELHRRQLPHSVVEPFYIRDDNRASPEKVAGASMGMLLPYMIILMIMVSCQYPAIDMTAGEKERGTMETLLVSPASRLEIVLGKFLTTMVAGLVSGSLSMTSMLISMSMGFTAFGGKETAGQMALHFDPLAWGMVVLLILPIAAIFASVLMAIAVNARSYKEAQSYVQPLMILIIVPAITSMIPGLEVDARMAFIPVVNVSLIIRNAFIGQYDPMLITLTFLSSVIYAAFAIFVAVRIFQKETVLLKT